ncbi:YqaE/Pmp3 family membrane protein [bacterium]|nr:YqaE/Pmp3 family membrane protein [bacterium]
MNRLLLLIVAFFLPPVAVALVDGIGFHFLLNIILWICGCGVAGIVHAFIVVLMKDVEITNT